MGTRLTTMVGVSRKPGGLHDAEAGRRESVTRAFRVGKRCTLGVAAMLLSACAVSVHLYPVQGPLSTQVPPPSLTLNQSGDVVSVVLEDGEVCSGPTAILSPTDSSARDLAAEWDVVYGSGYYVSHVLGTTPIFRATLTGNRGTSLEVENGDMVPAGASGGYSRVGVAKDSRGNIYKIGF